MEIVQGPVSPGWFLKEINFSLDRAVAPSMSTVRPGSCKIPDNTDEPGATSEHSSVYTCDCDEPWGTLGQAINCGIPDTEENIQNTGRCFPCLWQSAQHAVIMKWPEFRVRIMRNLLVLALVTLGAGQISFDSKPKNDAKSFPKDDKSSSSFSNVFKNQLTSKHKISFGSNPPPK